jgi:hypothetical protein
VKQDKTTGAPRHDQQHYELAAFDRVIKAYVSISTLSLVTACSYAGKGKQTLSGTSLEFKCDVEMANRKSLITREMREEWQRLVEERYRATNQPNQFRQSQLRAQEPVSAEQRELTIRVKRACGREYQKRQLDQVGQYFMRVRLRAET